MRFLAATLWVLIALFGLAGIGLSIGGIGDLHGDCLDFNDLPLSGGRTDEECDDLFRPIWWSILFAIVTAVLTVIMSLANQLSKTRTLIMVVAFAVLSTTDLMDAVERTLVFNDTKLWREFDGEEDAIRIAISGLQAMSVANWLILLLTTLVLVGEPPKAAEVTAPLA